jgi:hypothetical protein
MRWSLIFSISSGDSSAQSSSVHSVIGLVNRAFARSTRNRRLGRPRCQPLDEVLLDEIPTEHVVELIATTRGIGGRAIEIRKPSRPDAEQALVYQHFGIDWKQACPGRKFVMK